ncbi:MAG: DUF2723 domain-containing protein, partial [Anaerolineae bacterium]|nr:DUF2723 domain-containing protein [Anaerolineae bacterium]
MSSPLFRIRPRWPYVVAGMAGAVWGAGLSRTISQLTFSSFFFSWYGVLLCCAVCAVSAMLITLRTAPQPGTPLSGDFFLPLFLPLIDIFNPNAQSWRGPVLLLMGSALMVYLRVKPKVKVSVLLAVVVPLLVYMTDISPYVGRADTFEFQVVAPQLGVAHPSGYPLYILIGKLFSMLPFGTIAWRVNLSSSVLSACAAGIMVLILLEISHLLPWSVEARYRRGAALLTAWVLAFSPTLWSRSIEAEVYALNALLVTLVLWVSIMWVANRISGKTALPLLGLLTGWAIA